MCGVFGLIRLDGREIAPRLTQARSATASLAHRGPDHQGEWSEGAVYLGHRRLSVLDLSAAANQPFADPSGRHVLAYNGEVYNYVELRAELEQFGHRFRTGSDTEVVLAALIQWDVAALSRFDGMFAAIWHDRQRGRTVAFRDPLGQKPLYWGRDGDILALASELRALTRLEATWGGIDQDAFRRFLARSYYAWDETPLVNVRKLLPGCLLTVEGGRISIERWWESIPGQDQLNMDTEEAVTEFDRLFTTSCRQSMRCDVPYGVFLSGGIDSSLVLDYCREANPGVRAFSVAMGEADFDESAKAKRVARHLGIGEHRTFVMDGATVEECLDATLAASDEPHGDPGLVNAFFLARSSRPFMTVALAGDGGDELFAGYAPFAGLGAADRFRHAPASLVGLVKAAARLVPSSDRYLGLRFKLDSFLRGFPAEDAQRFALWLSALGPTEMSRLTGRAGQDALFPQLGAIMAPVAACSSTEKLLYFYQKLFLPEFVCMHTDRAAMQVALEVRAPLLSAPLIGFANRLPDRMKHHGGDLKWLLKRVAERRGLPAEIVSQKKQGFTFPVARWLKSSLKGRMTELLAPGPWCEGLLDPVEIARLRDEHLAGVDNHYRILFNLMVFSAWRRRHPDLQVSP